MVWLFIGIKRKANPQEVLQKRRKLQSLSEKMSESISRVLTQSTNQLIEEMRRSEERFMLWEEERRAKDRKQEEDMLKKLMDTIQLKSSKNGAKTGKSEYSIPIVFAVL
jgi:hypothetical protein